MDDSISRQDAVNELREYITEASISDDESEIIGYNDGIELAISVLSTLPSAQRWIPCSERLPDKEGEYLVTFNGKWHGPSVRALWYGTPFDIIIDRDKWVFYCDHEYGFETFAPRKPIVAWMPLPEPYKEENNGHD